MDNDYSLLRDVHSSLELEADCKSKMSKSIIVNLLQKVKQSHEEERPKLKLLQSQKEEAGPRPATVKNHQHKQSLSQSMMPG